MGLRSEALAMQFEAKAQEAMAVIEKIERGGLEKGDRDREMDGRRDRAPPGERPRAGSPVSLPRS